MRQKILAMLYLVIAAVMLLGVSCKKGEAGPAGPEGPPGTSNVIFTDWFNLDYNAVTGTNGDTVRFVADLPAPKLVDSIIANGEIKVYLNKGTPTQPHVVPLPYSDPIYFNPPAVINPDFFPGLIVISSNYNMGTFDENAEKRYQYRYILIPGGTAGRPVRGGKTVNWDNYKEVQVYLGLKD